MKNRIAFLICFMLVAFITMVLPVNVSAFRKGSSQYNECISDSGGNEMIESIANACIYCSSGSNSQYGTMWFNSSSSNPYSEIVVQDAQDTVTLYLRGQWYSCDQAGWWGGPATFIYFKEGTSTIRGTDVYNHADVDFISPSPAGDTLNRGEHFSGYYTWNSPNDAREYTLDVNKFKSEATLESGYYQKVVQVFRCPGTSYIDNSKCYSDGVTIKINQKYIPDTDSKTTTSKARINGGSWGPAVTAVVSDATATVQFEHSITVPGNTGTYTWKVFHNGSSTPVATGTATASGTVFPARSYTVNVPSMTQQTIVLYQNGAEVYRSTAVATVESEPTEECPVSNASAWSSYSGSNKYSGYSYTLTAIKSSVSKYSSWRNGATIYAKPDDRIYWTHCYYPGSKAVMKSSGSHEEPSWGNDDNSPALTNQIGEQDTYLDRYEIGASSFNKFTITTDNSTALSATPAFVTSNSDFSKISRNVFSNSAEGDIGHTVTSTSNVLTIKEGNAAETITQRIGAYVGTSSVSGHGTWTYHYTCINCCKCLVGYEPCGTAEKPKDCPKYEPCNCTKSATGQHYNSYSNNNWYVRSRLVSYDDSASSASVKIPYNFDTSASAYVSSTVIYAGQTASIQTNVKILPKYNSVTEGEYATESDNVMMKLITYTGYAKGGSASWGSSGSDICSYFNGAITHGYCTTVNSTSGKTLNASGNQDGSSETYLGGTYNVYDVNAGEYFCVAFAVYPANSGSDTNMSSSGNGQWRVSDSTCRVVSKHTSFQVWGGNLFSNGNIDASLVDKNNLYGYYGYQPTAKDKTIYFGSWAEFAAISNGAMTNFSSGASTGYTSQDLVSNPGGSFEGNNNNYCKRSVLSFANVGCSSSGGYSGNANIQATTSIIEEIKTRYVSPDLSAKTGGDLSSSANYRETDNIRRTYSTGSISIYASSQLPNRKTHIVYAKGNINITGNITYADGPYSSSNQIPQFIIISDGGNINISCTVERIDAWLLTTGTINTCSNAGNTNDRNRSYQLRINGPVVAKNLVMPRTYGTATGKNTEVPAEIINLTSSAYFWSRSQATETPKVYTVYERELAPRY